MNLIELRELFSQQQISATDEQLKRCIDYASFVQKFNKAKNLSGAKDQRTFLTEQLLDCAVAYQYLSGGSEKPLLDVGSGCGLPALVFALLGRENLDLVEIDQRRCAFLRLAIGHHGLKSVRVHQMGIEDYTRSLGNKRYPIVCARAFLQPERAISTLLPLLSDSGVILLSVPKDLMITPLLEHHPDLQGELLPGVGGKFWLKLSR